MTKENNAVVSDNELQNTQRYTYEQLLEGNKVFVENELKQDPDYFKKLAAGQNPNVLWIGCSDSRVPANQVTNTKPGDIFVHRNIANVCVHSDMNMLSVLDYAVNVLKVKHVIVAGHYGCGGVAAAMTNRQFGLIDNWLRHIKDVYRLHSHELDLITDDKTRANRLVELNVIEQVFNLCKTTIVQNAWRERTDLEIHGWVVDISTGYVKDMHVSCSNSDNLGKVFALNQNEN
ncbi:carbonic anhydrase [Arcticibacter eurypsychrophilus]|uniref:carbonic anhydrase n=1 Tax=Arcticibacter eurypsychrophilus TaxID=1434752 RepID=UPI00084D952B|nr:carbonic anhydrase [Arcticibacter eurypsychrophilus]